MTSSGAIFQAFSFGIVSLRAGESPENVRESPEREYVVAVPFQMFDTLITVIIFFSENTIINYYRTLPYWNPPPFGSYIWVIFHCFALFFLQKMFVLLRSAIFFDGTPPLSSNPGSIPETRIEF